LFVDPLLKSKTATFDSWHNLKARAGTQPNTVRFTDCGYMEIRASPNPGFPPGTIYDPQDWDFLPIDDQASTGLSFGSNYAQGGSTTNGRIGTACTKLADIDGSGTDGWGLAGASTNAQNPSGWTTIAVDLTDYIDQYVQIRFVMQHVLNTDDPVDDNMSGWYIDNFRLGDLLPQSASMTVRGMTPSVLGGENHPNGSRDHLLSHHHG
jgi:hypothetical protein